MLALVHGSTYHVKVALHDYNGTMSGDNEEIVSALHYIVIFGIIKKALTADCLAPYSCGCWNRKKKSMDKAKIMEFVSQQKTAFIASVDENGYPVMRAMLAPRMIEGNEIYFSTNTSSRKVQQYVDNNKACIYFYKRGRFTYQGVSIKGEMAVCTDQETKNAIWRMGDTLYYKQGVTDPDYCVLKFTCQVAEYYCDLHLETVPFDV